MGKQKGNKKKSNTAFSTPIILVVLGAFMILVGLIAGIDALQYKRINANILEKGSVRKEYVVTGTDDTTYNVQEIKVLYTYEGDRYETGVTVTKRNKFFRKANDDLVKGDKMKIYVKRSDPTVVSADSNSFFTALGFGIGGVFMLFGVTGLMSAVRDKKMGFTR